MRSIPAFREPVSRLDLMDQQGLEPLLKTFKDLYKKMPREFMENPIDVVKRNVHISPFWEEDLGALAQLIGEDQVLFGSDYAHPEGLAEPRSYMAGLAHLPETVQEKIMGGNLARLMNVPAEATV